MKAKKAKNEAAGIAKQRIKELFEQAEKKFDKEPELSNRYIELARKMAMRYRLRIPSELKKRFCSKCHHYLVPGKNCRIRTQNGKIVYTCQDCGAYKRYGYK